MKKKALILFFVAALLSGAIASSGRTASWSGVDETVIEKFAEKAGRPAWEPFINTDQGDLLLFVFLLAGAAGGFAAGYWFRVLFPPGRKKAVWTEPAEGSKDDGPGEHRRTRILNHDV
jgi:ABC-type cobalt transport system substrate-binding protein